MAIQCTGFKWSNMARITGRELDHHIEVFDDRNLPLKLELCYTRYWNGKHVISIYCKYWLVNTTGLRMLYGYNGGSEIAAGQTSLLDARFDSLRDSSSKEPRDWYFSEFMQSEPFLFSYPSKMPRSPESSPLFSSSSLPFSKQTCCVKIANSEWSKGLSLESKGVVGLLELSEAPVVKKSGTMVLRSFPIGASISSPKDSKFWRTKVITFASSYVLVNNMDTTLYYRQKDSKVAFSLLPKEKTAFLWPDGKCSKCLQISLDPSDNAWYSKCLFIGNILMIT